MVAVVAVVATAGEHLKRLGIDVNCLIKTEKSTAELQIELNLNYNFSAVTEEGASLVGGPCLCAIVCPCLCALVCVPLFVCHCFGASFVWVVYVHCLFGFHCLCGSIMCIAVVVLVRDVCPMKEHQHPACQYQHCLHASVCSERRTYMHCSVSFHSVQQVPLHGSNLVGMANLGNTCYFNSTMQTLMALDEVRANGSVGWCWSGY